MNELCFCLVRGKWQQHLIGQYPLGIAKSSPEKSSGRTAGRNRHEPLNGLSAVKNKPAPVLSF
jgi:hypothetical protein